MSIIVLSVKHEQKDITLCYHLILVEKYVLKKVIHFLFILRFSAELLVKLKLY